MQILVLFCLVAGSLAQIDVNSCPPNSRYSTCTTACPLTCENYQDPPKACKLICKIGCQCDEGYIFAPDGSCVLPEHCPAQAIEKSCSGEAETGLCKAYFPSWYYDTKSGTCKRFVYGGCGGNGNRYATEEECLQTCASCQSAVEKSCSGEAETGLCRAYFPSWYYDTKSGTCKRFIYGGCGGNGNRYATEEECLQTCASRQSAVEKSCSGEAETGLCRAYFPSWYYDTKSGTCKRFVYGGCGGNGNRYSTEEECLQTCADFNFRDCPTNSHYTSCGTACPLTCENYLNPPKVCVLMCKIGCECDEGYVLAKDGSCVLPEHCPAQAVEKSCSGEAETGLCRAYMPSWYFDTESGICKRFIYGGCGGNGNRYATEEECLQTCAAAAASLDVCDLPAERGVCKGLFRRYAFDRTTGQCKQFMYGGCGGNENNFKSSQECRSACQIERALDRPDCDKKAEPGNCLAYMPRYYYDQEAGMCKKFIYGGCGGNRNNFATEDECYNKCGALVAPRVELCEQEKETGFCRGYFPRYYYNKQTGECEQFIYGGCGGNDNNFGSKDNCEQVCKA